MRTIRKRGSMKSISFDTTNALCGAIFLATGGFFALQSLDLDLGTAFRMGPGYFPFVLSIILMVLGAVIIVHSTKADGEPIGPIAWRGMCLILPAPVFFGLTVRGLGFVPALFFCALIASFASARMRVVPAILLSAALTAFSVVVFAWGLGLPFQQFGPWLSF